MPQTRIPPEQLERFYQRYKFAANYVKGKRVLEVGFGGGQGLSLLKQSGARSIIGIDIEEKNVMVAQRTYQNDAVIKIIKEDIQYFSMPPESFDCIFLFEVIYYLADIRTVLSKCKRMLSPDGIIIIESANKEWSDFNPSPLSTQYFSAPELQALLTDAGFAPQLFYSFPTDRDMKFPRTIFSWMKRMAVRFHMIPRSMKYKRVLKRIFLGKLILFPSTLQKGMVAYDEPRPLDPARYNPQFKVLFAIGKNDA